MARFGVQVLGVEFVAVFRAWAEAAIITTTLGIASLGYLSVAQRLISIVQELTGGALIPVSTVAFAKVRNSSERVTSAYLRALRVTYAALSPPLILAAVAAPLIVPVVFGDGWSVSSQLSQILALAGMVTVGAALDHGLFYGMGKPGVWFVYAVIIDALTVGTTAIASQWGLLQVAWAFLVVALLATVARWFLVARLLQTRPRTVIRPFDFLCASAAITGASGWITVQLTSGLPPLVAVIVVGGVIVVAQVITVRLLAPDVFTEAARLIAKSRWGERRHSLSRRARVKDAGSGDPSDG